MKSRLIPLLALLPLTVSAEIQFNGFASIKGSMTFDDAKDLNGDGVIENTEKANFGAYDDNFSLEQDSKIALQATSDLGENLSATVQLFAEGSEDWDIEARWAYLTYQLTDETSISAGRLAVPLFYKSEFQDVGYAHNYGSLPISVYSPQAYEVAEGIRLSHSTFLGDWSVNANLFYGSWNGDLVTNTPRGDVSLPDNDLNDILSLSVLFNYDWLSIFGGYIDTEADYKGVNQVLLNPTVDGLTAQAIQAGLVSQAEVNDLKQRLSFASDAYYYFYGFEVDYNNWLFTAEYAEYEIEDSADSVNETWYVSFGRRFDNIVVLYTREDYENVVDLSNLNGLGPIATAVGTGFINGLAEQKFTQDKISVRYDFHDSAAFKFELFSYDPIKSGEEITGMTLGIDLLF